MAATTATPLKVAQLHDPAPQWTSGLKPAKAIKPATTVSNAQVRSDRRDGRRRSIKDLEAFSDLNQPGMSAHKPT